MVVKIWFRKAWDGKSYKKGGHNTTDGTQPSFNTWYPFTPGWTGVGQGAGRRINCRGVLSDLIEQYGVERGHCLVLRSMIYNGAGGEGGGGGGEALGRGG